MDWVNALKGSPQSSSIPPAAVVFYLLFPTQRLFETVAALFHQFIATADPDPFGFQLDDSCEYVSSPVEQRACQHGTVDPAAKRVGLRFVCIARLFQPLAGGVYTRLNCDEMYAASGGR